MRTKNILLPLALSVIGACFPAKLQAQFIGYQSPQTVKSTPLSAVTVPTVGVVPNLGQSIHAVVYVVASPCVGSFGLDLRIEASYDGTNFFSISEDGDRDIFVGREKK